MNKHIFTFGSGHLKGLGLNGLQVMLVVEGEHEQQARNKVFKSFIGNRFAFSYPYDRAEEFKDRYNMKEVTLEELEKLHNKEVEASQAVLRAWIASADGNIMDAIGYAIMASGQYAEEGKLKAKDAFNKYLEGFKQ